MGLSPRMRGNHPAQGVQWTLSGSIPAHAGKSPRRTWIFGGYWVYPRACGEIAGQKPKRGSRTGLSPRMRGNRPRFPIPASTAGSIPAHAGKSSIGEEYWTVHWVYPRACGEIPHNFCELQYDWGLSPRMRGNLLDGFVQFFFEGSIPAHAGKSV